MKMMECKKLRPLLQYAIRNYFIPSKPAELDSFSYIVIYLTNMTKYKAERRRNPVVIVRASDQSRLRVFIKKSGIRTPKISPNIVTANHICMRDWSF